MNKLLLKNFHLIDPSENLNDVSDLLIEDGIIKQISPSIDLSDVKIIDGNKNLLLPGLIDFHVHYRDPGETYKEDIKTGSEASAKGGFTTVIMMSNTNPTMDNLNSINAQKKNIDQNSRIRIIQTSSVTIGRKGKELVDIDLLSKNGVVSFSDDGDVIADPKILTKALKLANKNNRTIFEHCEEHELVKDGSVNSGRVSIRLGLRPRPKEAEINCVKRDIEIAKKNDLWVYLQHISCKESVLLIREAKNQGVKVTAEVTPHHLFMNDFWTYGKKGKVPSWIDLNSYDTNTRVNPPLRSDEDRISLLEGVRDGTLDIIATDHAPHSTGDKLDTFDSAPAGINGAETALITLLELVNRNELELEKIVTTMCNNPGAILNNILNLNIGRIKKGYKADLVVIDNNSDSKINEEFFISKSLNSPLIGSKMKGKIMMTIFDGKLLFEAKK